MSSTTRKLLFAAAATTCLMIAFGAQAADVAAEARKKVEDSSGIIKMNELLCKDIMRYSGDDRLAALAILHGYYLGKKGATEYVMGSLARVSDDFTEYCLDRPSAKALESFAKFVK
jgi:hypothetical protein